MRTLGNQTSRQSLWSQSGQFWLGAFMVAEAPLSLVVLRLPEMTGTAWFGRFLSFHSVFLGINFH